MPGGGDDDEDFVDGTCGGMTVYLKHEGSVAEIHVGQPYSPDVLADMSRHAVTALGALFPEDDDEDLRAELEAAWRQS